MLGRRFLYTATTTTRRRRNSLLTSSSRTTSASKLVSKSNQGKIQKNNHHFATTSQQRQYSNTIKTRIAVAASSTSTLSSIIRWHSSSAAAAAAIDDDFDPSDNKNSKTSSLSKSQSPLSLETHRLSHLRNVGILAHVDAGKTTVTERMLALAGIVHRPGSVDAGSTVTDYLPAERERGITIQSAAISFDWPWHNAKTGSDLEANDDVTIHLIDTPGHVDFSVEVNRSVAVLDGAVLVLDAVAGVQAQTETVWNAITRPSVNNHLRRQQQQQQQRQESGSEMEEQHSHEPLPCVAVVNKMDRIGCSFQRAIQSIKFKLIGANPLPIQIPLFAVGGTSAKAEAAAAATTTTTMGEKNNMPSNIIAISPYDCEDELKYHEQLHDAVFTGVVDLIHMRAILYPTDGTIVDLDNIELATPTIIPLHSYAGDEEEDGGGGGEFDDSAKCKVTQTAKSARSNLIASLANVDEPMEEYYLMEEEPTNAELRSAVRRQTLARNIMPVMACAALKGQGVEPLLDAVADLLPSPLDRQPPVLKKKEVDASSIHGSSRRKKKNSRKQKQQQQQQQQQQEEEEELEESMGTAPTTTQKPITLGHPLHPSTLALAFKVVHMKGRGGSGDGRVVFARVYSGSLRPRDQLKIISKDKKPITERIGGMLELAGGKFDTLEDGVCSSGDVCALVGLKNVVTGDTILLASEQKQNGDASSSSKDKKKKKKDNGNQNNGTVMEGLKVDMQNTDNVYLAGVSSPPPVLTVRVEAPSPDQQAKLTSALKLLSIEDPSLQIEETEYSTHLSGLGELHIEIVLDRLAREFGLDDVEVGKPAVSYRETVVETLGGSGGSLYNYDRTVGGTRMQASLSISLEPMTVGESSPTSSSMLLTDPIVTVGPAARSFLDVDEDYSEDDLMEQDDIIRALILGCTGSLSRGCIGPYPLSNVRCVVHDVDAEGGLQYLKTMPGALRAAAASAVSDLLMHEKHSVTVLEPCMSLEVTVPGEMVGTVLSDLNGRRGTVGDVVLGDDNDSGGGDGNKGKQTNNQVHSKALIRGEVPLAEILGYANGLRSLTGGEAAFTAEYKGHAPCEDVK